MSANPDKLKAAKTLSRPDIVFALARAPRTGQVFCGGSDFSVYQLDLEEAKPQPKELGRHDSYVTGLACSGATLVSGGYDSRLIWWNAESHSKIREVTAHARWIRNVAVTPDGSIVASVADDMVCRLWELSSGRLIRELRGHAELTPSHLSSMLYALAISSDGTLLATGDKVGHIVIWDLQSGRSLATLEAPALYTWDPIERRHSIGGIRSLAFSPDGKTLVAGGSGRISNIDHLDGKATVEVFDWQKGERTHSFVSDKFKGLVERLEFHPGGAWLLGGGGGDKDGFLMFFDIAARKALAQEKSPMALHSFALNESSDTIYAVGHKKIVVYEMKG